MIDSAALARLTDQADAKLVLIGAPAQLGEIEAGGLFGSIVARTDPVVLDQVIRHEHDLDREGARRIWEGRERRRSRPTAPRSASSSRPTPRSAARRWSATGGAPGPRARTRW